MYFLCYGLLKNLLLAITYYKRRDIRPHIIRYRRNGGPKSDLPTYRPSFLSAVQGYSGWILDLQTMGLIPSDRQSQSLNPLIPYDYLQTKINPEEAVTSKSDLSLSPKSQSDEPVTFSGLSLDSTAVDPRGHQTGQGDLKVH